MSEEMKRFIHIAVLVAVTLLSASCRSQKVVPVRTVKTDSVVRVVRDTFRVECVKTLRDTLVLRDSIYIMEYVREVVDTAGRVVRTDRERSDRAVRDVLRARSGEARHDVLRAKTDSAAATSVKEEVKQKKEEDKGGRILKGIAVGFGLFFWGLLLFMYILQAYNEKK